MATSRASHAPSTQPTAARLNRFTKEDSEANASTSVTLQHGARNRPSSTGSLQHGRSHSHPLTSLFRQARKEVQRHRGESVNHTDRSHHKLNYSPPYVTSSRTSSVYPESLKLLAQDKELISGRCATCDSTVRWPKHLSVFRCTICLMVNDLQSREDASLQQHRDDDHAGERKLLVLTYMLKLMVLSSLWIIFKGDRETSGRLHSALPAILSWC